jgi:riboflavin kinase / FMN adenylyltransferase
MNVIQTTADLNAAGRPVCVAIGVFDGVHIGHQRVLRQATSDAAGCQGISVAVTFDRHPNTIVAPASVPPLIYPLSGKLALLGSLGLDTTCVIRFDKPFSQISGMEFVRILARDFGRIQSVCVGANFMFGFRRSGNVALLQELGGQLGFVVRAVPDVDLDGLPVSSTRLRDAIRSGAFGLADKMLGRSYALCGPVIPGRRLGRKFGFPTANIDVRELTVPPGGVYAAQARVGTEWRRAAVNIGHRPTIQAGDPQIHVEAHLLDFDQDIVGQDLELTLLKKLREETKFPSTEALRAQIAQDVIHTRNVEV